MPSKSGFKPPGKPVSKMPKPVRSLTDSEYDDIFKSVLNSSNMEDTSSVASSKPALKRPEQLGKPSTSQMSSELGSQRQSQHASQLLERESQKGSQFFAELNIPCSASSVENFPTFRQGLEILERSTDGSEEMMPPLSQPPRHVSQRQRLMWMRDRRGQSIYVQCTKCHKWRYTNIDDPVDVPDKWTCIMNTGKEQNRCEAEEEMIPLVIDEDTIHNQYTAGSVVWAKMASYPWWPGIIDDCPDTLQYYWLDDDMITPTFYHVVFFDKPDVSRKWIPIEKIKPFKFHPNLDKNLTKSQRVLYGVRIEYAKVQATNANMYSVRERLFKFGFLALWKYEIKTPTPSSDDESRRSHSVKGRQKKLVKRCPSQARRSSTSSKKWNYSSVSSDESVEATTTSRSKKGSKKAQSRRSSRSSNKYCYSSVSSEDESVISGTTNGTKKYRKASMLSRRSSRARDSDDEIPLTQSSRYTGTSSRYTDSQNVSAKLLRDHIKKIKQAKARNASRRERETTPNGAFSINLNGEFPTTPNRNLITTPNRDLITTPNKRLATTPDRILQITPNRELPTTSNMELPTTPNRKLPTTPKGELSTSPLRKRAKINRTVSLDDTPRSRYSSQRSSHSTSKSRSPIRNASIYDICSTDDSIDENNFTPKQNAKKKGWKSVSATTGGPSTSNNKQNNQKRKALNKGKEKTLKASQEDRSDSLNEKIVDGKISTSPKTKRPRTNRAVSLDDISPSRRVSWGKSKSPSPSEISTQILDVYLSNNTISEDIISKQNTKKRGRKPKSATSPMTSSQEQSIFTNTQNSQEIMSTPPSRRSSLSISKSRSSSRNITSTRTNELHSSNESISENRTSTQNNKKRGRKPKSVTKSPGSSYQEQNIFNGKQNSQEIMSTPRSRRSSSYISKSRSPIRNVTSIRNKDVYSSNESINENHTPKQNIKKRGRKPKSVIGSPGSSYQVRKIFNKKQNSQEVPSTPRSRRSSSNISKSRSPIRNVTRTNDVYSSNESISENHTPKQNTKKRVRKPKSVTCTPSNSQGIFDNKQNSQEIKPTTRSRRNSCTSSKARSPIHSDNKTKDKSSKTQGTTLESTLHPIKIKIEKEGKLVAIKTEPLSLPGSSGVKASTSKKNHKGKSSQEVIPFSDSLPLSQRSAPAASESRKLTSSQQKCHSQELEPFSQTYERFCEKPKSAERPTKSGPVINEDNKQGSSLDQKRKSKSRERSPKPILVSQIRVEDKRNSIATAEPVPNTSKVQGTKPRGRPKKFVPPTVKKEVESTVAKLIADSDVPINMGDLFNSDPNDTLGSLQFSLDDDVDISMETYSPPFD